MSVPRSCQKDEIDIFCPIFVSTLKCTSSPYIYAPQKNLRATVIFSIYSCVKHPILNQNLMALPKVTECLFHLLCFR